MRWFVSATMTACFAMGAHAKAPDESPFEAELERATRCLRRADFVCAEKHANAANDPQADRAIRREALVVLVTVAGKTDGDAALATTRARCQELMTLWPNYEPPPDATPTVARGCQEARQTLLEARLPKTLDPGPAPLPEPEEAVVPPPIYRPAHLDELPPEEKRFSISIGAGVALPIGDSADRFGAGIQALVDLRFELSDAFAIWIQGGLALLRLDSALPIEPHQGSSLTVFSATLGLEHRSPLVDSLELVLAPGLGVGGFGLESAGDAMGLAISPSAGVRYLATDNLSVRADVAPTVIVPFSDIATGGHLAFVLRGEARF